MAAVGSGANRAGRDRVVLRLRRPGSYWSGPRSQLTLPVAGDGFHSRTERFGMGRTGEGLIRIRLASSDHLIDVVGQIAQP